MGLCLFFMLFKSSLNGLEVWKTGQRMTWASTARNVNFGMSFFRIEISLSYFLVTSFWPGEKALANIQNALHNLAFIRNVVKVVQSKVYFVLITLGQKQKFAINISDLRRLLRSLCWLDFHGPVTPQNICSTALLSPFRWQLSRELHLTWWQKVCSTDRHQCRLTAGIALGAVVVCPGTPQGVNTSGKGL